MQYDPKDMLIYTTGVVGRAMGSGVFSAAQIKELTQAALAAFLEDIAPKLAQMPREAPASPQWQARGPQQAPAAGVTIQPETKQINIWGGDKAYMGGKPQMNKTWGEWLWAASEGDEDALNTLRREAAKTTLGEDPQWRNANQRRIARAKAVLKMVEDGYSEQPPPF